MEEPLASRLQQQIDDLAATVARNVDLIDDLTAGARVSHDRADAAERRADSAELRADRLEARADLDRRMIEELQKAGAVDREHIEQIEAALRESRTVGVAAGLLMASRSISYDEAFVVLAGTSERTGMPIEQLARTIVAGAATLH